MQHTFGIIGGDRRYRELAALLRQAGHTVYSYGLEALPDTEAPAGNAQTAPEAAIPAEASLEQALSADVVWLPLPLCREDGILRCAPRPLPVEEVLDRLRSGQRIFTGQIPPSVQDAARKRGLTLTDLLAFEPVAVANAAATAEAAIHMAMNHTAETLAGMPALVTGFGRIGKLLCRRLAGLGSPVTAAARSGTDRAWIQALGYAVLETGKLSGNLSGFRLLFNTVPAPVLDGRAIRELPPGCLLLDLASRPGIDFAAARARGLTVLRANSLPGRMVPRTAAIILRDAAEELLRTPAEDAGARHTAD